MRIEAVRSGDILAGHYTVIGDPEPDTDPTGRAGVRIKVEYLDGGTGYRTFDPDQEVPIERGPR